MRIGIDRWKDLFRREDGNDLDIPVYVAVHRKSVVFVARLSAR